MSKHLPPIPPAGRSPKGPGGEKARDPNAREASGSASGRNLAEQGRQGNTRQNTTHQGLQQDR